MKKNPTSDEPSCADQKMNTTHSQPLLTVILAIRTSDFSFYERRLSLRDLCDSEAVTTVLVDDGSPEPEAQKMKSFCGERNWRYVYIESGDKPFSLARARNVGLHEAESEWVYIDDADMAYPRDFFQKLLDELFLLDQTPFNFVTIPAVYLTAEATTAVQQTAEIDSHVPWLVSRALLEDPRGDAGENSAIQSFSPASAMLAMRRKTAFTAGVYDEEFEGWGGEDREFVFRLLSLNSKITKPKDFAVTKHWNLNDTHAFEGWRSLYRLLGDYMGRKGFYAFHLFHEQNSWRGPGGGAKNFEYAKQRATHYSISKKLPCIAVKHRPRDVIIGFNPFMADQKVRETLENPEIIDEVASRPPEEFVEEVLQSPVNSVIMWNPYKKDWRLSVYNAFRDRGINPIIAERGALPNSVYFDANGLCIVSDSYSESNWSRVLNDEQVLRTKQYIHELRFGEKALEAQSQRIGAAKLVSKLKIPPNTHILFAPLQLLDDTVTSSFHADGRDYRTYLRELEGLSRSLPKNWMLVYKNHPLSVSKVDFATGICADSCHINDLLEACDAAVVFNSGTGLLAQAFGKRVFYFGECFYAIDGVNSRFETIDGVLCSLSNLVPPDPVKIIQFYHFLRFEFYSFAEMRAGTKTHSKFSLMSKLQHIDYNVVRIPGFLPKEFKSGCTDLYYSPLFDVYRFKAIADRGAIKEKVTRQTPIQNAQTGRPGKDNDHVGKSRGRAKLRKLFRDPSAFFRDSRFGSLRELQRVFRF